MKKLSERKLGMNALNWLQEAEQLSLAMTEIKLPFI
jgi:hypothetical protein